MTNSSIFSFTSNHSSVWLLAIGLLGCECARRQPNPPQGSTTTPPALPPFSAYAQPLKTNEWVVRYDAELKCPELAPCTDTTQVTRTATSLYCRYRCDQAPNTAAFPGARVASSEPVVVPLGNEAASAPTVCSVDATANTAARAAEVSKSMSESLQVQTRKRLFGDEDSAPITNAELVKVIAIDTSNDRQTRMRCSDHRDRSPHARNVVLAARMAACGGAAECGDVVIESRVGLGVFGVHWLDGTNRVVEYATLCRDEDVALPGECQSASTTPVANCLHFDDTVGDMPLHDPRLHGGYMGTRADLAQAIESVTTELLSNPRARMVVNLSVGWHGKHDCDGDCPSRLDDATASEVRIPNLDNKGLKGANDVISLEHVGVDTLTNPESESVFWAIARARCLGAIVVAAAGNAVEEDRAGPLMPAGWEQVAFNDITKATPFSCNAMFSAEELSRLHQSERTSGLPSTEGRDRPIAGRFIYAVAGVNSSNGLLYNAREGSIPRLLAHGQSVAIVDAQANETTTNIALSGSSMAAASVSGVIAASWSRRSELHSGAEVVEELYDAAAATESSLATDARTESLCPSTEDSSGVSEVRYKYRKQTSCGSPRLISGCLLQNPNGSECAEPILPKLDRCVEARTRVTRLTPELRCREIAGSGCIEDTPLSDAFSELDMPWAFPQPNPPVECATCTAVFDEDYMYLNKAFAWSIATAELKASLLTGGEPFKHRYNVRELTEASLVQGFIELDSGYVVDTSQPSRLTVTRAGRAGRAVADLGFVYYDLD